MENHLNEFDREKGRYYADLEVGNNDAKAIRRKKIEENIARLKGTLAQIEENYQEVVKQTGFLFEMVKAGVHVDPVVLAKVSNAVSSGFGVEVAESTKTDDADVTD